MSIKNLPKKLATGIIFGTLIGCSGGESPDQFTTLNNHMEYAHHIARMYHGGVKVSGADLDIDNDQMNDLYVVCEDETVYHTRSRRLLTGDDSAEQKTWYRTNKEAISTAKKGTHDAV